TSILDTVRRLRDDKDLPGAVRALARALADDPTQAEGRHLLEEIITQARGSARLLTPATASPPPEELAVHAYALAPSGQIGKATEIPLEVLLARPQVPYLRWAVDWLRDHPATRLDLKKIAQLLGKILQDYPRLEQSLARDHPSLGALAEWIELASKP